MQILWESGAPLLVRELTPKLPALAYTTVMTTLERLHRKGWVRRERRGRAYAYAARASRENFAQQDVTDRLAGLLRTDSVRSAVLSAFVESVGRHDASLLDELEALVQAERARLTRGDEP